MIHIYKLKFKYFQYLHKSNHNHSYLFALIFLSVHTQIQLHFAATATHLLAMQIRANNAQFIKWTAEHKCINLCMLLSPPSRPLNSPTIGHLQCQLQTALSYEKLFSTQNSFCFGNISQLATCCHH